MPLTLTGTKEKIFDISVKLISEFDYESINLREVAKQAGIKASSIYNHFSSKKVILDTIYSFYADNFSSFRTNKEVMKRIIETGTCKEIINAFNFTFENNDPKKYMRMVLITKIIYLRIGKDKVANDIFLRIMTDEQHSYVKELLDYGITIGRFNAFDTSAFAKILCGTRHIMGIAAFIRTDYTVGQLEEEKGINEMFSAFLSRNVA